MSFDAYARWRFEIPVTTDSTCQAILEDLDIDKLRERLEDYPGGSFTDIEIEDTQKKYAIIIDSNGTTEVRSDFDDVVEELWKKLHDEFGVRMTGYVVAENSEGAYYRGDFTEDGKLDYVDVRQFADFKVEDLRKLLQIAKILEGEEDEQP